MERSLCILLCSVAIMGCHFKMELDSTKDQPPLDSLFRLQNAVSYQDVFYTTDTEIEIELMDQTFTQVMFSAEETCTTGSWQSYQGKAQYSVNVASQEVQTVFFKAKNPKGIETLCHKVRFTRDVVAPSAATLSIAADASVSGIDYVRTGVVGITATAVDPLPVEMKISTDSSCSDGQWAELLQVSSYTSSVQHDESLRLYVKYRDKLGNETACISSNQVKRDSEGPVVSATSLLVAGRPLSDPVEIYDRYINLSLSAVDPLLSEMKISNDASCAGGVFEPYSVNKVSWDTGLAEESDVSVIFTDHLGNTSSCVSLRLVKGVEGPTGALSLVGTQVFNGLTFITSTNVQLNITATNAAEMRFFNDSVCSVSAGAWEPLAANKNWTFGAGQGAKEVGIQFRDASGTKISTCVFASAILDSVAPTDAQVIPVTEYNNEGRYYTSAAAVDFLLSATDASLAHYEVRAGSSCGDGSTKQSISTTHTQSLPGPSGVYSYSFQFFDFFGRASSCVTRAIIKDSVPGSAPILASLLNNALGNLNETPRLFLKNESEAQSATQSGTSHYEMRIERVGTGIVLPWLNVGKSQSFAISGLQGNADLGTTYQANFAMVEGADYRLSLRAVDNVGNASTEASITFKAKPAPIILSASENAATGVFTTREFKATGVGAGTQFSLSDGAKVCKVPCDLATAQSSISLEEGANYQVGYSLSSAGTYKSILTVGSSVDTQTSSNWHLSTARLCPTNYILIPGDPTQRIDSFCLAKFEMKNVGGVAVSQPSLTPWNYINRANAAAACAASGGRLPTSSEWNVTALNIAKQNSNWSISNEGRRLRLNSGVSTGSSVLAVANELEHCSGAGAACGTSWAAHKRTHIISTGEIIWDFSGNVWEITSSGFSEGIYTSSYWPVVSLDLTNIFSFILVGGQDLRCFEPNSNSFCGMGRAWLNNADVAGQAINRGGSSNNGTDTGIFAIDFDYTPAREGPQHGFRCARSLP